MKIQKYFSLIFIIIFSLLLSYITIPLGTFLGEEIILYVCKFYYCINITYPDIIPYSTIHFYTLWQFFGIIFPLWLIIVIFWILFFRHIINILRKKKAQNYFWKYMLKITIFFVIIIILLPKIIFLYSYFLWSDYQREMNIMWFYDRYKIELSHWPFHIFQRIWK